MQSPQEQVSPFPGQLWINIAWHLPGTDALTLLCVNPCINKWLHHQSALTVWDQKIRREFVGRDRKFAALADRCLLNKYNDLFTKSSDFATAELKQLYVQLVRHFYAHPGRARWIMDAVYGNLMDLLLLNLPEHNLHGAGLERLMLLAIQNNQVGIVRAFLPEDKEFTHHHYFNVACTLGKTEVVQLFLDYGADANYFPDRYDSYYAHLPGAKNAPLYNACEGRHFATVQLLLEYEADIELASKIVDSEEFGEQVFSPQTVTCLLGWKEGLQLLLDYGAEVCPELDAIKPINYAVQSGKADVFELLCNQGALNYCEAQDYEFFMAHAVSNDCLSVVETLIDKHGVDFSKPDEKDNWTHLHRAIVHDAFAVLRFLLAHGAQVTMADFQCALTNERPDCAELLLINGFDIHQLDPNSGENILTHAVKFTPPKPWAIDLLASYGFDVKAKDNNNESVFDVINNPTYPYTGRNTQFFANIVRFRLIAGRNNDDLLRVHLKQLLCRNIRHTTMMPDDFNTIPCAEAFVKLYQVLETCVDSQKVIDTVKYYCVSEQSDPYYLTVMELIEDSSICQALELSTQSHKLK